MLTLVIGAPESHVQKYARQHLQHFRTKGFQRRGKPLTALQSKDLDQLGKDGVEEIAIAHGIPLLDVSDKIPEWP